MPNTYNDADTYVYDENEDEFILITADTRHLLQNNGNTVVVSQPDMDGLQRYQLNIDDFGYIIAALVKLFPRLGLKV